MGDSLAVLRVPLAAVFGLAVLWTTWPRRLRWPLVAGVLVVLGWHGWMNLPNARTPPADFTLYQQNLLQDRADRDAFVAQVLTLKPDFLTLQEVSNANLTILASLRTAYPYQVHCPLNDVLGEAVLSRYPMGDQGKLCSARDGIAALHVDTPNGSFWVVSVHLSWPWPYGQPVQVAQVLPDLQSLSGPVIMAGDFNAVAWSHTVRKMGGVTGTQRVGRHARTYHLPWGPMAVGIDHVLTGPAAEAQWIDLMPKLGSDHHGLLAHLRWPNDS